MFFRAYSGRLDAGSYGTRVQEIRKESQEYTRCTRTSRTQSILSKQVILERQ
jgi:ribosomal protein S14